MRQITFEAKEARVESRPRLPAIHRLLDAPAARRLAEEFSRSAVVRAMRAGLREIRLRQGSGTIPSTFSAEEFLAELGQRLRRERLPSLRRVINATGIVLHTNLGRAPLAAAAIEAVVEIGRSYSTLELDTETGRRGSRHRHVEQLLCQLTGAEAALVVNNNAAAVLVTLAALGRGGEVVVSHGELVEIGGSFRLPDIIAESGARLVAVGTTNKTRLGDYERVITEETRILLKVHPSNYRIVGFTSAVPLAWLAGLARERHVVVMEDLGSGLLVGAPLGAPDEPVVRASLAAGADIVTCSGDKLLGGPQAGLILGRAPLIERLRHHPLMRAMRIDKLSLAALEATLRLYLDPERLAASLPVAAMLGQTEQEMEAKARRLVALLAAPGRLETGIVEGVGYAGSGSLPEVGLPTRLVTVRPVGITVDALAQRLRAHRPAVIGRIAENRFVMDMRTVSAAEIAEVAEAIHRVLP